MGNSESQYSLQGTKNHTNSSSGAKQKPCSLKIRSIHAKDEKSCSIRGWSHSVSGTNYKSRSLARSCLSHFKNTQPYSSRLSDTVVKVSKSSSHAKHRTHSSESYIQGNNNAFLPESGFHYIDFEATSNHVASRNCNGHFLNCYGKNESVESTPPSDDRMSPKVLIKTLGKLDGCLRVEFHNSSSNSTVSRDESSEPVQLLRYSPTLESERNNLLEVKETSSTDYAANHHLSASDSRLRSSKGSSISSESSWYDAPWGNNGDINELDGSYISRSTPEASLQVSFPQSDYKKPLNQSSSLSSLRDLYGDTNLRSCQTSEIGLSADYINTHASLINRVSFTSAIDVPSKIEHRGPLQYSSYTLPCRKSTALNEDATKKETLKSRMRRISDWTGSLSRKKRKLQEPKCKDSSEYFDIGIDSLSPDTAHLSGSLWSPSSSQIFPQRSDSANAISSDVLRQNIYENFMRELDLSRTNIENTDTSTETEDSSNESLSSLEQLDLLYEKEQGVVRKAGWLFFKPLVTLQKEKKLELVTRRKWKQYWVTLKGCTLLFYETYGRNSMELTSSTSSPRYALFAEDSIVQSCPEHPKKENVFCLSNSFGDVYLFQATSQTDLENWVTAIHSASASLFAKKLGKEDTVRLLKNQTKSLIQKIDMDSKMKKMAELQLSIVSDPKNRKAIENQIQQWEQNLEKFNMDLFRMRCYLASLQGGELPNPKSLLAAAGRPSKIALGRLGIFSVSSFHALICSRDEAALRKRTLSLSQRVRSKKGLFSSLKGLDTLARKTKEKRPSITQIFDSAGGHGFTGSQLPQNPSNSTEKVDEFLNIYCSAPESAAKENPWDIQSFVHFPDGQGVMLSLKPDHRVEDVLALACKIKQLEPRHYGLQLRKLIDENVDRYIPEAYEYIQDQMYDEIEIFPLSIFEVHLTKNEGVTDFGFAVTAQVDERQHLTHIFISDVLPNGMAYKEGLRVGNEILIINEESVSDLDLRQMELLFSGKSVMLTLTSNHNSNKSALCTSWSDGDISREARNLLPPPNQSQLLEEFLDNFKKNTANDFSNVPDVTANLKRSITDGTLDQVPQKEKPDLPFRSTEQISALCPNFHETHVNNMEGIKEVPPLKPLARQLTDADRLRKVIQELLDTEKSYVKDLSCLFQFYLEPLQSETFLTQDEMESLFGSLPEMLDFQKVFLETLEDGISSCSDFDTLETPSQFRKLLFSLGGSFLYYADHFKLYSGFCANHIKVQKVLERAKTDKAFKAFLDSHNPTKQHSSTLESFLIKPVQRVLKYPLLLKELVSLTDSESEEHYHLTEALKAMEKVASHINEMQKIYEDYGAVFDQLVADQSGTEKEVTELSMGELLLHSSVSWLNPFPSLGKTRKDLELTVFVFKRAVILVYKENCKLKKKLASNVRPAHNHGDLDLFKFRWLIPLSALQVRLGNTAGTENNCIWELIHTKSELEGRPETTFQLCSSDCESKTNIVKVIRSILRENFRRQIKCDSPLEKTCKNRLVLHKNRIPVSAKLASSRSLKLLKSSPSNEWNIDAGKGNELDSDECSLSSSTPSSSCHTNDSILESKNSSPMKHLQNCASDFSNSPVKESDILSDEEDDYQQILKKGSPTKDIEIQFQRLKISENRSEDTEEIYPPERENEDGYTTGEHPKLVRAHFCPIKRKVNSTRRDKGTLLAMQERHQSLDSHPDAASFDLNSILEREFSVQSLASVVNEDCFYETVDRHGKS